MDAENVIICTACGARNKASWEFCARCAEPLDVGSAAPPALEALAADADVAPDDDPFIDGPDAADSVASAFWAVMLFLLVVGGIGVLWWSVRGAKLETTPVYALPILPPTGARPVPIPKEVDKFIEARARMWHGDAAGALPLFDQLVVEQPENAVYRFTYGQALWDVQRWDDSLNQLRAAARLAPEGYGAALPHALAAAHHTQEALREFDSVAAAQPANSQVVTEYAELLGTTGDYRTADRVLRRALALNPQNLELRALLGSTLEGAGDVKGAQDIYRALLSEDATRADIRARLAHSLWTQGQGDEARTLCVEGLRLSPNSAALHRDLGEMMESAGELKEAAAHYREAARLSVTPGISDALIAHAGDLEQRLATTTPS